MRSGMLASLMIGLFVLALACQPTDRGEVFGYSETDTTRWRTTDILLLGSDSGGEDRRIFSAKLPLGWDVRNARPREGSWSGQLVGHDFTLDFQGGPMAVSVLDDIVGRGSTQLDEEKAAMYLVTEEEAEGRTPRTLIRPQAGERGVIGMIMDLEDGQLLITGREMSVEQQDIAFAVFRSITPGP